MIINNNNAHTFNMFYNVLGGNPLFKGSTIIRFVLICSIDTLCFWTSSFTTKYFNFICLAPLEYLSFLQKYYCGVITIHFQRPSDTVDNSKPWNKVLQPISLNCSLKTCYKFSFQMQQQLMHTKLLPFVFHSISFLGHCARLTLSHF